MRVEIVQHYSNALGLRVQLVHHLFHTPGKVRLGPPCGYPDMAPAALGLKEDKKLRVPRRSYS